MKAFAKKVQRFMVSEDGPTAVEYAVMLALIIIVCLTAISSIGDNASEATFEDLDVDSLDLAELSQIIEDEFGVQLKGDDVGKIKTVGDAIDLVVSRAG